MLVQYCITSETQVMALKWPATTSATEIKAKRLQKSSSLETKLLIVKRHEGSERANSIARFLQLPHSSVFAIIKQAADVKKAGERTSILMAITLTVTKKSVLYIYIG